MSRVALPQPYRELEHTADLGLEVEGATADEALARLLLALSATIAGGGEVTPHGTLELEAEAGERAAMAVDLLRAALFHFATRREIVAAVEVLAFEPGVAARVRCEVGPFDPGRHEEAGEIKAVTRHAACFEPRGEGWMARVILDV